MNEEILIELGVVTEETKGVAEIFEYESYVCDFRRDPDRPC